MDQRKSGSVRIVLAISISVDAFPECGAARSGTLLIGGPFALDRQITDLPVQPPFAKIFSFPFDPNHRLIWSVSSLTRGRWPSSRTLGWDAVDAKALLTNSADRGRRSRVALTPRRWRQVARIFSRSDGDNKPVTGESSKETVKTIAQGRP